MDNRLKELRESRDWTHEEIAARMGLSRSGYIKIERGERRLTDQYIQAAARVFEVSPAEVIAGLPAAKGTTKVTGPVPLAPGQLPYAGIAGAGGFRPVDEYFNQDDGDHLVPAGVMAHPAYPKLQQSAWKIQGTSMDQAGILDGMWAVAASYADYVDQIGELQNGTVVIVERTRYGGSERELTIKEAQFARRGMRLIPRSSNPAYKEFFVPLDEDLDPDEVQITILGVLLWAGFDFDPRTRGA